MGERMNPEDPVTFPPQGARKKRGKDSDVEDLHIQKQVFSLIISVISLVFKQFFDVAFDLL